MNRFKTQRKLVSTNKFSRLFSQNLECAGVASIWKGHDVGFVNSLQAVLLGNFLYCRFPCNKPEGNRLKTYTVRYDLTNPMDYISFTPYPRNIFAPVQF